MAGAGIRCSLTVQPASRDSAAQRTARLARATRQLKTRQQPAGGGMIMTLTIAVSLWRVPGSFIVLSASVGIIVAYRVGLNLPRR